MIATEEKLVREMRKDFIKEKKSVTIYYNNENGKWIWSVQVDGTDFWLNSFSTPDRAVRYCNRLVLDWTLIPHPRWEND